MRLAIPLLLTLPLLAEKQIRVDSPSDNRSYLVDLDSPKILSQLRSDASSTPAWLAIPGVVPTLQQSSTGLTATYSVRGTLAQWDAYYRQLLASQRYAVEASARRNSSNIYGSRSRQQWVEVQLGESGGVVTVRIITPPAATPRPKSSELEIVSYDDSTGILALKDKSTGLAYYLDRSGIRGTSAAPATSAAVPSMSAANGFPSFVPIYPASRVDKRLAALSGGRPGLEMRVATKDTPAKAAAWYRYAFANRGFCIREESSYGSGSTMVSSMTAVDSTGAHAVKVRISPSFSMPTMVCEPRNNASPSPFAGIGACQMSEPDKASIEITYLRAQ